MKSFLYLAVISIVTIPTAVFAQNYLVGIPGVDQGGGDFDAYIQAVYVMFISIAALLAVVKIIIAGLKYMFTDIVTQKGDAKKDIQGAVFGLLIVMSAVLILTVINPELTGFNFEQDRVSIPEVSTADISNVDATTIQSYCEANNGNCESTPCDVLATDYFLTWLVNDPVNRLSCSAFCTGEIVGRDFWNTGQCLHPIDEQAFREDTISQIDRFDCIYDTVGSVSCQSGINQCESTGREATIEGDQYNPYVSCN
ncbi:MAG: hypothetical protein ACI9SY_000312 [Candidatus Paceibacteria bacterium]